MRRDGRAADALRPVSIETGWKRQADGSCLYRAGGTVVLLTGGSDLQRAGWITRAMISMDPWLAVGFAGSWKIVWLRNFLRAV